MEEKRKIVPFLVILIVTQVSIVIGGLVGAIKGCGLFLTKNFMQNFLKAFCSFYPDFSFKLPMK